MSENKGTTTKPQNKKKNGKSPPSGASVQDVTAHASRLVEAAALVRAARDTLAPTFAGGADGRMPDVLLQRPGAGPRPASVDAVLDAEAALEEAARRFEDRARDLLKLRVPVELGDGARADGDELVRDEAVRRADVAFGFGGDRKNERRT